VEAKGAVPGGAWSLLMEIICAECGCVVHRAVIVAPCAKHPDCCCGELEVRAIS